jgi:hypothetical protein
MPTAPKGAVFVVLVEVLVERHFEPFCSMFYFREEKERTLKTFMFSGFKRRSRDLNPGAL